MDGRHNLDAQISALESQWREARRAVAVLTRLDGRLGRWAQGDLTERLDDLKDDIDALGRGLGADESVADRWTALIGARDEASELFAECLALAQGAWAREQLADAEVHRLADRFVAELNDRASLDWDRLTVPAERELYADLAQVIRVSYPSGGVWELPLAAHEFGHFAAERLAQVERRTYRRRRRLLVSELLEEQGRGGDHLWARAGEYFADAFATYATGPAYPWAFVVLRAEPLAAGEDDFEHPAPAKRVALMLEILALMDRDRIGKVRFTRRRNDIAALWRETLTAAGEDAEPRTDVQGRAKELYDLLRKSRKTLAYDGFDRAQAIAGSLNGSQRRFARDAGTRIVDVVNAAWICRVDGGDPAQIDKRARALCLGSTAGKAA